MIMAHRNELETVSDTISGRTTITEETFCSAAILADRLESLREISPAFEAVTFSPDMEDLMACEMAATLS